MEKIEGVLRKVGGYCEEDKRGTVRKIEGVLRGR